MASGPGRDGGAAPSGIDVTVSGNLPPAAGAVELERAVVLTLEDGGVTEAEISLTLLDDQAIRDLNLRYLGKDCPTDVIAFALGREPVLLGDIYVGAEQAARQASELGVPLAEEMVRLAVHGTLHVLGLDHPDGEDREESPMFALQEDLVRRIRG